MTILFAHGWADWQVTKRAVTEATNENHRGEHVLINFSQSSSKAAGVILVVDWPSRRAPA
jgi:hypothetical protein